ncbi:MAG: AbrB/MazE/SpoVT family DNA-binding domain-containing protein [Thermodesulfobacteriota bacterium]
MELVKIKRNYQITIPQNLRKRIRLEVGDYVEVDAQKGSIIIRPISVIRRDQEYFHTQEWQAREAQADRDITQGELLGPFTKAKEALKALKTSKA